MKVEVVRFEMMNYLEGDVEVVGWLSTMRSERAEEELKLWKTKVQVM